jgi:hypothetical protein
MRWLRGVTNAGGPTFASLKLIGKVVRVGAGCFRLDESRGKNTESTEVADKILQVIAVVTRKRLLYDSVCGQSRFGELSKNQWTFRTRKR